MRLACLSEKGPSHHSVANWKESDGEDGKERSPPPLMGKNRTLPVRDSWGMELEVGDVCSASCLYLGGVPAALAGDR